MLVFPGGSSGRARFRARSGAGPERKHKGRRCIASSAGYKKFMVLGFAVRYSARDFTLLCAVALRCFHAQVPRPACLLCRRPFCPVCCCSNNSQHHYSYSYAGDGLPDVVAQSYFVQPEGVLYPSFTSLLNAGNGNFAAVVPVALTPQDLGDDYFGLLTMGIADFNQASAVRRGTADAGMRLLCRQLAFGVSASTLDALDRHRDHRSWSTAARMRR